MKGPFLHTFLKCLVLRFQLLHLVRELLVGLTRHSCEVVDLGKRLRE